jgi:hypothetical protein
LVTLNPKQDLCYCTLASHVLASSCKLQYPPDPGRRQLPCLPASFPETLRMQMLAPVSNMQDASGSSGHTVALTSTLVGGSLTASNFGNGRRRSRFDIRLLCSPEISRQTVRTCMQKNTLMFFENRDTKVHPGLDQVD